MTVLICISAEYHAIENILSYHIMKISKYKAEQHQGLVRANQQSLMCINEIIDNNYRKQRDFSQTVTRIAEIV